MANLVIATKDGKEKEVDVNNGVSVMEAARDNGFDEMLALCGGCCSCATCHVYVEGDAVANLPAISPDENDLLDSSDKRTDASRLACQLKMSDALSGLKVTIIEED